MRMNRREFLMAGALASVGATSSVRWAKPACRVALLSDLHLDGTDSVAHQNRLVAATVESVLKLKPRPGRVVVLGDIACYAGRPEDYRLAAEVLRPFADAGIPVELVMGNHDRRDALCDAFPACRQSEVPGRIVRTVDCGVAALVLLDSHDEGNGDGAIDPLQERWLESYLDKADKPTFVCVHHDGRQMKRFAASAVTRSPQVVGYLHGHRHAWLVDGIHGWKGPAGARLVRSVGLPSAGFWGDVGFAVLDCFADEAVLTLHESDCFFPTPESQTPAQRRMRAENDGARIVFPFASASGTVASGMPEQSSGEWSTGPLDVLFTGTGGADWKAGPREDGERRAFSGILLDGRVLIDWHGSARANLPVDARPEAIVQTHSHGDHFSPDDAIALGSVKRVYVERGWCPVARMKMEAAAARAGVPSPQVIAVDLFSPFVECGLVFRALPANHRTDIPTEQCVIYQVRKLGADGGPGVGLLYATDTGGLMKEAVDGIDGCLTAIVMNAMIGPGQREDRRIFSHCTAEQVAETAAALRTIGKYAPPEGRPVWTTHLSRELNGAQDELKSAYPRGVVPSHDGLRLELK